MDAVWGIFNGVVEHVDDGGAKVFRDAQSVEADGAWSGLKEDAARGEIVTLEGNRDAVGNEGLQVDECAVLLAVALAELASLQNLLNGGEETVGVGEHDGVELLLLFFGRRPALEGFEVQADAGDGGFEFVSDGVEEGVLTLVAADLANQEDGVENDAGDESGKQDDAKDGEGDGALVQKDPADIECDGKADGECAEGDEEGNGSAASSDVHGSGGSIEGRILRRARLLNAAVATLRQVATAVAGLADAEVSAAAAVDPQAALVKTPGVAADAGRAADLADELNIATVANGAPVSFPVVGGAGDNRRPRRWGSRTTDHELGSAATVDPQATLVEAPGVTADARRAADLADELDIAGVAYGAPVSFPVVGGAGDPLGLTVSGLEGRACGGRCNGGRSESNGHHQKEFR